MITKKSLAISILILGAQLISAAPINAQTGENLWHLLAAIGTEMDAIVPKLAQDYAGTFTTLDAIENTAITIETKLDNLQIIVDEDFAGTFSALAAVDLGTIATSTCPCQTTPITLTSAGTVLTSGTYCLTNDVTLSGSNTITLSPGSPSYVTFDLNGHTITGGGGIVINGPQVNIKNGTLKNITSMNAISNSASISNIIISDMQIDGCILGINLSNDTISDLLIQNVTITNVANGAGIFLVATNAVIEDCIVSNPLFVSSQGFTAVGSNITFKNCITNNIMQGFLADGAANPIVFDQCIASQSTDQGGSVGFLISASSSVQTLIFSNCVSQFNQAGFQIPVLASGSTYAITNCSALGSDPTTGAGFSLAAANGAVTNCSAQGFNSGFFLTGTGIKTTNCTSSSYGANGAGFTITSSSNFLSDCIAIAGSMSATTGFNASSSTSCSIAKSTAIGNHTGFNGNTTIFYLNNALGNMSNFAGPINPNTAPDNLLTSTLRLYGDNLVNTLP